MLCGCNLVYVIASCCGLVCGISCGLCRGSVYSCGRMLWMWVLVVGCSMLGRLVPGIAVSGVLVLSGCSRPDCLWRVWSVVVKSMKPFVKSSGEVVW